MLYAGWTTNLPRFQGARLDHVRVQSSCCCFPRELVSFWPTTRDAFSPNRKTYLSWEVEQVGSRKRPHYAVRIWKRSFISMVRPKLPSTLILHENGAFRKRSSNRGNLKKPAFRFHVDGKHLEIGAFRNRWRHDNNGFSLSEFSFKLTADHDCCAALKFLQRVGDRPNFDFKRFN